MLGMVTAFAEIIEKFRDEPIKAFRTIEAVAYHTLNGCISAFALLVLRLNDVPFETHLQAMNAVVLAGVGSMLLMRSRLFNVKVGNEDIAFGPEQIIKIYFRFMERAIDRVRAQSRIAFVRSLLSNLDFERIHDYTLTMLDSAQALSGEKRTRIEQTMERILADEKIDTQLKSYRLGFLLLTEMGEDFLLELFQHKKVEWRIAAPPPVEQPEGLLRYLPGQEHPSPDIQLFSYGPSMYEDEILKKLGWQNLDERKYLRRCARNATLPGYRLVFNKPAAEDASETGLPNIEVEERSQISGVLYRLPAEAFEHYALNSEPGYERRVVTVYPDDDKKTPLDVYALVATETAQGLSPSPDSISMMLKAAKERALSGDYMGDLEELAGKAA